MNPSMVTGSLSIDPALVLSNHMLKSLEPHMIDGIQEMMRFLDILFPLVHSFSQGIQ